MRDKKYYKAQFITLRHKGRAARRDVQTDEEIEGTSLLLSNKEPDIDIRWCRRANCCLNYLL